MWFTYFLTLFFLFDANGSLLQKDGFYSENPILPTESKIGYYSEINRLNKLNESELFKPASTLKILTAFTSLQTLGEHYQFETLFKFDISKNDSSEIGNLELIGNGDPTIGAEDFGEPLNKRFLDLSLLLKNSGILKVNFPLKFNSLLKKSDFRKNFTFLKGWTDNDINSCYGFSALPSAFHFRENCALYSVTGLTTGTWDLSKLSKKIISNLTYGNRNQFEIVFDKFLNQHVLNGTYIKGSKPGPFPIPLLYEDTLQLIESEFISALLETGITITHDSFKDKIKESSLIKILSPELKDMLKPFLKNSLNFVGESLMLAIGKGDYESASIENNINLNHFSELKNGSEQSIDGSGLSRENKISPKTLWNLLNGIKSNLTLQAYFLDFFPISGTDGTLKNRLDGPLTGKIHAKTGSLDGISNLVGYALDKKNNWQPFVILNQSSTIVNPRDEVDQLVSRFLK